MTLINLFGSIEYRNSIRITISPGMLKAHFYHLNHDFQSPLYPLKSQISPYPYDFNAHTVF